MEENKIQYLESSIAAFRAIRSFVFQKGAYPKSFDAGTWKEEDYEDPDYRRAMRNDFEAYLELLATANNQYAKALYDAMPYVESEYNNLVINSRNMEQAIKLFRKKFEEVMFAIEWQMDINKTVSLPVLKNEIIRVSVNSMNVR